MGYSTRSVIFAGKKLEDGRTLAGSNKAQLPQMAATAIHRLHPPPFRRRLVHSTAVSTQFASPRSRPHPDHPLSSYPKLRIKTPSILPQTPPPFITQNPHSLSPPSLYNFFTWLSSPGNSTFRHTLHTYCTMIHFLCTHQMMIDAKGLLQIVVSRKGKDSAPEVFAAMVESKGRE